MSATITELNVTSSAFEHMGRIPDKYTGRNRDISPELSLTGISSEAKSLAIVMDDLDIPFIGNYTHWLIWNIPVQAIIPEDIPQGKIVECLNGANQGIGYGKHGYRGPKPPFFIRTPHRYEFTVYTLDCKLDIACNSKKKDFFLASEAHILQKASIIGVYKN